MSMSDVVANTSSVHTCSTLSKPTIHDAESFALVNTEGKKSAVLDLYAVDRYESNCCCPFSNPEAAGFVLIGALPVGVTIMSNVFFSAAILELANRAAG